MIFTRQMVEDYVKNLLSANYKVGALVDFEYKHELDVIDTSKMPSSSQSLFFMTHCIVRTSYDFIFDLSISVNENTFHIPIKPGLNVINSLSQPFLVNEVNRLILLPKVLKQYSSLILGETSGYMCERGSVYQINLSQCSNQVYTYIDNNQSKNFDVHGSSSLGATGGNINHVNRNKLYLTEAGGTNVLAYDKSPDLLPIYVYPSYTNIKFFGYELTLQS